MNPIKSIILKAFLNRSYWLLYYNIKNDFFAGTPIDIIHDAKTISVAIMYSKLLENSGYTDIELFVAVREIFSDPSLLRVTSLIDLKDFKSFELSINAIQKKYDTLRAIKTSAHNNFYEVTKISRVW